MKFYEGLLSIEGKVVLLVVSGYLYEVLVSVESPPGVSPGLGVPVPAVAPDHLALAPHLAHQGCPALISLGVLSPAITGSWHNTLAELGGLMALISPGYKASDI